MTHGYSNELYDAIASFGLRRGATILDVGSETGTASEPFAVNGFPVTHVDPSQAHALPFPDERFDVVVAAQMFHTVDRASTLAETYRVLRPAGIVAVWWKHLMSTDGVKAIRDQVFLEMGKRPVDSGLNGGFKEFYASAFTQQTLRVIPWRVAVPLDRFLERERSQTAVREELGTKANDYFRLLERRLRERAGDGNPTLSIGYIQYLYMAKKP